MKQKTERNAAIIAESATDSVPVLMARHSLSRARIYQIINPADYAEQLKRKNGK